MLELSIRTSNVLHRLGVKTLEDVRLLSEAMILACRNSSPRVLQEILDAGGRPHQGGLDVTDPGFRPATENDGMGSLHVRGLTVEDVIRRVNQIYCAGLEPDEVLVLEEGPWVAVLSRRYECTPPGQHPLALALSRNVAVVSLMDAGAECYRDGQAHPIDVQWLVSNGARVDPSILTHYLHDAARLAAFMGWCWLGHRDALEAAPVEDYPPGSYLVLPHG